MERCIRCGRELVQYHINNAFYFCNGTPDDPHPEFLITEKLIQEEDGETSSKDRLKKTVSEEKITKFRVKQATS